MSGITNIGLAQGPANSDPYFDNVVLLLDFEGSVGGSTITDKSQYNHRVVANGNAILSNTQVKFGDTAGYFDGTNGTGWKVYQEVSPLPWDIGNEEYTFEFWTWRPSGPNQFQRALFAHNGNLGSPDEGYAWSYSLWSASQLRHTYSSDGGGVQIWQGGVIPGDSWVHVAYSRSGDTMYQYFNGVFVSSRSLGSNFTYYTNTGPIYVGRNPQANTYIGYIDSARFTRGISRYPDGINFSPPTETFPTS